MNKLLRGVVIVVAMAMSACAAHATLPVETQTEILTRYAHGDSFDELAQEFRLQPDQARVVVHDALLTMYHRYYNNR